MKKYLLLTLVATSALYAQISSHVQLLGNWTDPTLPNNPFVEDQVFNEVWGYAQNGHEYGIIGSTVGLHFVDVTDTAHITEVDRVLGKASGTGVVHRDFKNFGHYLYAVCDEGPSSLQIIDMQYLPDSVHVVYDSDELVKRSHNLFIDTATEKLYLFGAGSDYLTPGSTVGYAVMVFSIQNPEVPQWLANFYHSSVSYVHDGYVFNDTVIFNGGNNGLYYGYMGDPSAPEEIGYLPFYEDQGYNHSGWMSADHRHYVMSDETHGMRMKVLDLLVGPDLLSNCSLFGSGVNNFSIPHNQLVRGNFLYVSYYHDGLRIWDVSDPCNPISAGFYDTYPGTSSSGSYNGAWGTYPLLPSGKILVSDMLTGLYVLCFDSAQYMSTEPEIENILNIYPNPATDWVQLSVPADRVVLYDLTGKELAVYQQVQQVPVLTLQPGYYILVVTINGKSQTIRVVKN